MIDGVVVEFEPMKWTDVPAVMEIERRSFTLPWSASTYRHEILENANAHYYVLRRRERSRVEKTPGWLARRIRPREVLPALIGYGGFWFIVDEAHISTIAIGPEWRGRGLGEYLLASLLEQTLALKAAQVTLEVRESNRVAQNLYRKYGFRITGKRAHYYQDNHENAFLMTVDGVNTEAYRRQLEQLTAALAARLSRLSLADLPAHGANPYVA